MRGKRQLTCLKVKTKKINEAKGKAQEITILAEASAQGINMVADSINQLMCPMAIKMKLVEDFIGNLGEIMEGSDISVLPMKWQT